MKVYVVQEVTLDTHDMVRAIVIGVYSTKGKAREAIENTKQGIIHSKEVIAEYKIIETELNHTYTHPKKTGVEDTLYEKTLYKLIGDGLMEVLIGEDGNFYYELTNKGQSMLDDIEKQIRKKPKGDDK